MVLGDGGEGGWCVRPPTEECCDSGRSAAAVLSAKMAAHSPYRHRASLRRGRG